MKDLGFNHRARSWIWTKFYTPPSTPLCPLPPPQLLILSLATLHLLSYSSPTITKQTSWLLLLLSLLPSRPPPPPHRRSPRTHPLLCLSFSRSLCPLRPRPRSRPRPRARPRLRSRHSPKWRIRLLIAALPRLLPRPPWRKVLRLSLESTTPIVMKTTITTTKGLTLRTTKKKISLCD